MATVKLGIIGTGNMGNKHARSFRAIRGVKLTACYDLNVQQAHEFAHKHRIPCVASSVTELIERTDAVSVVTPDATHSKISLQVLDAGKHLLCEKPLATTLADARKVARKAVDEQELQGTVHMVNFSYRDSSAVQESIKLVQRGDLGQIRYLEGSYLQSWLASDYWGPWDSPTFLWRLQTAKGSTGVLGDVGCHLLDLVTAVAGDATAVDCSFSCLPKVDRKGQQRTSIRGHELDANDTAIVRLHYVDGLVGVCHATRWATGHKNRVAMSLHGTEGALRINLDDGFNKLHLCTGKNVEKARWTTRTVRATPSIYQRFIRSIRIGQQDQPDIERGAHIQSYLDACERSSKIHGKKSKLRPWM